MGRGGGSHKETVDIGLNVVGKPTFTEDIQLALLGRSCVALGDKEHKWVLCRVRYDCDGSGGLGLYAFDAELCADHIAHPNGADDTRADNDCKSTTRSLFVQS